MINITVFSLNRACQLDLFLSSMEEYFKEYDDFKINVLYTYSNKEYKLGYDLLKTFHPEVNFVFEKDFKSDLINLIKIENKYTQFFVDDMIWKDYFSIEMEEFKKFENDKHILSLSLRLHPNLTYCYAADVNMNKPKTHKNGEIYWKMEEQPSDYSYPMSVDGNIYRTEEILNLITKLNFKNPNQLEHQMSINPLQKAKLLFFENSKVLNNPCNKVQTNNQNKHGNIDAKYLNDNFLKNMRLSFEKYKYINNKSVHIELPIEWE